MFQHQSHLTTMKLKANPNHMFNVHVAICRFKTQINLQRHKEYHSGEKFSCRTCGRVYPSNSTLKQHEISHSTNRPHKCNICMKTFKRSQDLKFHINQHTGDKPYQCPFCPKACKWEINEFMQMSKWNFILMIFCFFFNSVASSGNCFSHRKRVHSDKSEVPVLPSSTTTSIATTTTTGGGGGGGSKRTNAVENSKKLVKA